MQTLDIAARVWTPDSDGDMAGQTAFFVDSAEGAPVLVTAAHCLVGSRDIPLEYTKWFQPLTVLSSDRTATIEIHIDGPDSRARLIPSDDDPNKLKDLVLLPVSAFPELRDVAERSIIHRLSTTPPYTGLTASSYGFASADGFNGPLRSIQTAVQSEVLGTNGWLWLASPPAVGGLSGGPLLTETGECIGMQTGYVSETDNRTVFIAANAIRSCLV